MTRRVFFLLCVFVLLLAGPLAIRCTHEIIDVRRFFSGIVADSLTGDFIDSAWIDVADTLEPHHAYTDTAGYYLVGVLMGTERRVVRCGKEGYFTKDTVILLDRPLVENVNFRLAPKQ
ncbi:MAG: hypothetical protein JSU69_04600 [Candidatus Zixiibacteriota bacterium]|nr:MAG: hypothetical protein JSU69_04600 [candidate division Zixibacteria bacterium]